jgi:hypothetical protein
MAGTYRLRIVLTDVNGNEVYEQDVWAMGGSDVRSAGDAMIARASEAAYSRDLAADAQNTVTTTELAAAYTDVLRSMAEQGANDMPPVERSVKFLAEIDEHPILGPFFREHGGQGA